MQALVVQHVIVEPAGTSVTAVTLAWRICCTGKLGPPWRRNYARTGIGKVAHGCSAPNKCLIPNEEAEHTTVPG
jgi:hypothetical protein